MTELFEKSIRVLELPQLLERLSQKAVSEAAKERALRLTPSTDADDVRRLQDETDAARALIGLRGSPSFSGVKDVREALARAERGGMLNPRELLTIAGLLTNSRRVREYYEADQGEGTVLDRMFDSLHANRFLEDKITTSILSEDEIADAASPELTDIRRHKRAASAKGRQILQKIISSPSYKSTLQEALITQRDGRFVVPVKADHRGDLPGLVHDISASGATLFVEPMGVVQANNELKELEAKEKKEIERILFALSAEAAGFAEAILWDYDILVHLDLIFARGELSYQMDAARPEIRTDGSVSLRRARHPLLDPAKAVPIDIEVGRSFDTLVITGPNTGGKTVSLKTLGLLCLMAQCGLHIPAGDRSAVSVFTGILADIGDEQSIEQSLSTFSAHMKTIVNILDEADGDSLVLFDELGAGTDPTEGAALATAILANLHKRHTLTMATTHYSELKLYALQTPDVENACCEFDVSTLRPTYRLLIGVPGKSNAFAISHKLGLSDDIIEDAKHHVASDATQFEDVLADLEQTRIRLEKELADASESRKEISRLRKELREKNDKIDNSKERILQNANEEAGRILAKAKDYADETIRKYTKWAESDAHIREMEAERTKLREQINSKQSHSLKPAKPKKASGLKAKDLFIGADVRILSLNSAGTVSTLPNDKGDLFVQAGLLRTKVNIRDLELIKQPKPEKNKPKNTGSGRIGMSKAATMHQEVNLIGMTVDQAMPVMEKYLDDAYLAHMTQVTVIHGRGTGALRTAVHNRLKKLKYVKSYRLGEFGEGDMGVTIVTFKS